MTSRLPSLPAVHRVLASDGLRVLEADLGRALVREAVREALALARGELAAGGAPAGIEQIVAAAQELLARQAAPPYPEVLNATGVLIHTNLGRAPRLTPPLPRYLALEYDLEAGERGERLAPVLTRLRSYFGCQAATVVTNNAAALVLLLATHAYGREVLVSRGELIEIGGSFRLPEIMAASGARLVEVGCTNRTYLTDYERSVSDATAGILVVHRSNFHLGGFVASPEPGELAAMARRYGLPVWIDQGSGCHLDMGRYGLRPEPTVQQLLEAGADAVLFSGDKLLAGPQAGVLVGAEGAIAPMRRHPLRRALRPDKSALVALAATIDAFLAGRPERVPLYQLLATPPEALRRRARRLVRRLRASGLDARVVASRAVLGGGTTPDQTLDSWALALNGGAALASRLRAGHPPTVVRLADEHLLVDLRAIFPEQDAILHDALLAASR